MRRGGTVQWDGNLRITKQRKIKNSESEGEKISWKEIQR